MLRALPILLFAPCALLAHRSSAQNLVPNPGFEVHTNCPDYLATPCSDAIPYDVVALATPWQRGTCATSDYYNACTWTMNYNVPDNFQGWQQARTGEAYVGLWANGPDLQQPYYEYVTAPLLAPLLPGVEYEASMYVSLGDNNLVGCDRLGMYFSQGPLLDTVGTGPWQLQPQVESVPGIVMNDAANWTLISGRFIANGTENRITIGNFYSMPQTTGWGYYYIDDVSVTGTGSAVGIEDHLQQQGVRLGPNPMVEFCDLQCMRPNTSFAAVSVFSAQGSLVRRVGCAGCTSMRLERGALPDGWYFVQVEYTDGATGRLPLVVGQK